MRVETGEDRRSRQRLAANSWMFRYSKLLRAQDLALTTSKKLCCIFGLFLSSFTSNTKVQNTIHHENQRNESSASHYYSTSTFSINLQGFLSLKNLTGPLHFRKPSEIKKSSERCVAFASSQTVQETSLDGLWKAAQTLDSLHPPLLLIVVHLFIYVFDIVTIRHHTLHTL